MTVGQRRVNSPAIKPFFWTRAIVQGCVALMQHKQDVLFSILVSLNRVGGGRGLTLAGSRFNSEEVLYDLSN